ncbi:uncharacterized protein DS421_13g418860 [Arachis hypogaea]|nr:uncharacterized protein DS421_13g418860 [Arachis hypogaea]
MSSSSFPVSLPRSTSTPIPSKCSIVSASQPCTAVLPCAAIAPNLHCTELPSPRNSVTPLPGSSLCVADSPSNPNMHFSATVFVASVLVLFTFSCVHSFYLPGVAP